MMRLTVMVLLASCLAAAASEDIAANNDKSEVGTLDAAQAGLDPVAVAEPSDDDGEARDKRRVVTAGTSAAQRRYSMVRGMTRGYALQPYWLPFDSQAFDGAPWKKAGEDGILVVPLQVQVSADEYLDTDANEEPTWSSGGAVSGVRRYSAARPVSPPASTRKRARPQTSRTAMLRDYEPSYSNATAESPTPPPAPTNETRLLVPPPIESSRDLVKQFRKQIESIPYEYDDTPEETMLEPPVENDKPVSVVVKRRRVRSTATNVRPWPGTPTVEARGQVARTGPVTFPRPMSIRGEVYVRNSRYKEPFTVWEEAGGATRTELQGGAATAFRVPLPEARVQLKLIQVERSSGSEVRKCAETPPFPFKSDEALQRHPALPDFTPFKFAGYVRRDAERAEAWRWELTGKPGQLGAAPEEVLTFHHEMILMRGANDTAMPLKYTLKVDSSVVGANSDGYEIRYSPVTSPAPTFDLDPSRCDETETLSAASAEDLARLEPLREFTGSARDPRYDAIIEEFKSSNGRKYNDSAEESVRKNLVMQNSRFVASGNRAGQTFSLGTNFLSDRLDKEAAMLNGVEVDLSTLPPGTFPYSEERLSEMAEFLPPKFDWREHNGVTPVRFQGMKCKSCWAFAVTGAVEGALFIQTKELRALSEQSLVDCAQPYGGGGCRGTWPEHAYEYITARGLPELNAYPYNGTVNNCSAKGRALPATRIAGYVNVPPNNIDAIKVAIRLHAPVVVLVDVNSKNFSNYKSGTLSINNCKKTKEYLKHAMLAVGWDNENGHTNLIIKNSWTSKWGDNGYVRMQATGNTCGVLTLPTYPELDL